MPSIIQQHTVTNAKELEDALTAIITAAKTDRLADTGTRLWTSEINCDFGARSARMVLVKDTLTDGSHVYNIELR